MAPWFMKDVIANRVDFAFAGDSKAILFSSERVWPLFLT